MLASNALRIAFFAFLMLAIYTFLRSSRFWRLVRIGCCGVVSFIVKGGREAAMRFMNALDLIDIVVHVADVRSSILHPASTTHRQLSDAQLAAAGIDPGMVRFSVGIENIDDIIADLAQALSGIEA